MLYAIFIYSFCNAPAVIPRQDKNQRKKAPNTRLTRDIGANFI